jgi:acyl dehydratase
MGTSDDERAKKTLFGWRRAAGLLLFALSSGG